MSARLTRKAVEEAADCVRACSGLGDHREVRVIAVSAGEECSITLGTLRALTSLAQDVMGICEEYGPELAARSAG